MVENAFFVLEPENLIISTGRKRMGGGVHFPRSLRVLAKGTARAGLYLIYHHHFSSHPRHSNGNSHMALGDRRSETTTAGSALGCARGRTPGWVWRCDAATSRYKEKYAFLDVSFTCSQKIKNDAIFVNIEGFRPCLSKPSYRAPKWTLMVRLM